MILEACIQSYSEALMAEKKGAHRLEICSDLHLDGLTPSIQLVSQIQKDVNIPLKVMIRPRAGDFNYSYIEIDQMIHAVESFKTLGVNQFVLGILDTSFNINLKALDGICLYFPDSLFTIHKAIDLSNHIVREVNNLKSISNVKSILTSGGAPSASQGIQIIREMIKEAGTDIQIIAAGGITNLNLSDIHELLSCEEYHGRKIVGDLT